MSFTFLHTADWQLGKPFASIRDEAKRHRVQEERVETVRRLGKLVTETGAQMVMVAGDLFDSSKATKATVSAACAAIGSLQVPVLVIPGNHDHGGPGSIWDQEFFLREQQALAPNLRVLLKQQPVVLEDHGVVVFPAPLLRRHETGDPTGWIRSWDFEPSPLPAHLPRVVLAHGTVQGFGASQEDEEEMGAAVANWIEVSRLPMEAVDYVALGDWHGTKQIAEKVWYAGTPEVDRFPRGEGNAPGHVLKVTVDRGESPVVERMPTGRLQWREMEMVFAEDSGLDLLAARLEEMVGTRGSEFLLKLKVEGVLGIEAAGRLEQMLESWEARLLRLKLENRVSMAPSQEELEGLTHRADDPLVSAVAGRLVEQLSAGDDVARVALRELHAACVAVRG
jgi:DNA repair exonuclease SbcCD nuclease subunit